MGVTMMALMLVCAVASGAGAQEPRTPQSPPPAQARPAEPPAPPQEEQSVTEHSIRIGGQSIPYKATAGTILLKNAEDEPIGLMYSVAYTRSDVKDLSQRPVSFFYNGGPGSATMWLHMGSFGPKRAWTVNGEFTPPAPYKLVDNEECLLDKTDLVFVDAMGTGYSRVAGKGKDTDFYGIDEDAAAFAQFIVAWITRNERWNSPKFLMGESYGTFRSAVLANRLQSSLGVHLNGIVLISSVLDLSSLTFAPGDDRPYIYYLPSYAAVAWYHKALKNRPANLLPFIDEARQFAKDEYAAALFKGANLPAAEKAAVARRMSYFTGLGEEYLMKADLRVNLAQFNVELQRDRGITSGRIDARFTGYTFNLLTERAEGDPQGDAVTGAFTALVNHYNNTVLKFGKDREYYGRRRSGGWNWTRGGPATGPRGGGFPGAPNVMGDLASAMIDNPKLLVMVENGYYDMATPFFPTEFTMTHLGLPAEIQKNLSFTYYESGHMMYLRDEDRVLQKKNISAFIDRAMKQ